ncbi:MAG: hypothetical protein WCJ57_00630 [Candidatus Falkowbacteria bacterium]
MISILSKDGKTCLIFEGEEVSSHEENDSLIEEINDEYVDCQRIYEPTYDQKKQGYKALRVHEQKEIEEELLEFNRKQNGPLTKEIYFDE